MGGGSAGGHASVIIDIKGGGANAGGVGALMADDQVPLLAAEEEIVAKEEESVQQASSAANYKSSFYHDMSRKTEATSSSRYDETIDVQTFIQTRLTIADSEDAAYPRDTLLHYGYEGEGMSRDLTNSIYSSVFIYGLTFSFNKIDQNFLS